MEIVTLLVWMLIGYYFLKPQEEKKIEEIHTIKKDMAKVAVGIGKLFKLIFQMLAFVVFVFITLWTIASIYLAWADRGKVVVYERCAKSYPNPTTYNLSADKSYIISSTLDLRIKFQDCTIIDIENWECRYPDEDIRVKMADGKIEDAISWEEECEQISPALYYFSTKF